MLQAFCCRSSLDAIDDLDLPKLPKPRHVPAKASQQDGNVKDISISWTPQSSTYDLEMGAASMMASWTSVDTEQGDVSPAPYPETPAGLALPSSTRSSTRASKTADFPTRPNDTPRPELPVEEAQNSAQKTHLEVPANLDSQESDSSKHKKSTKRTPQRFKWSRTDVIQSYQSRFGQNTYGERFPALGLGYWPEMACRDPKMNELTSCTDRRARYVHDLVVLGSLPR